MSMQLYFDPLDKSCKSVIGAIKENERVQFNVFLVNSTENTCKLPPKQDGFLLLRKDGENMDRYPLKRTEFGWTITIKIAQIGLYFYAFEFKNGKYLSCNDQECGALSDELREFVLTVYSKTYQTPDWFKGGFMYQIFPDRFAKYGSMPDIVGRVRREDWGGLPSFRPNAQGKVLNNDFFGGNLNGITKKLSYLKSLGVTVLYLNPIFKAYSNHRYDTGDYMEIDPYLGTKECFANLVQTAKDLDIRIILDGVFNHTGDDSVYFNKYGRYNSVGAYQSKDSPYADWYTFEEFPEKYESWWGIDILPQVNEHCASYQSFIFDEDGVLKTWLKYGIGGYRLDVADELPDFFLQKLRKSVKETDPDAIIIGEVWEDASTKVAYSQRRAYLQGFELDSVMNYPWKDAIISYLLTGNAQNLLRSIRLIINRYPKQTLDCLMNILGTHDTPRILTVLGEKICQNKEEMATKAALLNDVERKLALQRLHLGAVLQFTLPGVPCVYYGDENAMEGHIDPFCRQCFNWEDMKTDLIAFYQTLGRLRDTYKNIFKDGSFELLSVNGGFLMFARKKGNQQIVVVVNNSSKPQMLKLPYKMHEFISSKDYEEDVQINAYAYGVFVKSE